MAIVVFLCGNLFAYAEQPYNQDSQTKVNYIQGVDIPVDTNPDKTVVRDRVELDTGKNASAYKEAQYKAMERNRVLNEVFDPMILMTPVVRVIRPIDAIGISPAYITQIILPDEMIITDIVSSFETKILESKNNNLRIRPNAQTFFAGNLVLSLTDGTKNYTMNIFVERYYRDECEEDNQENKYICRKKREIGLKNESKYSYSYNNMSTLYKYVNPEPIDDMEVIALYERLNGKSLHIEGNGDMEVVNYQGISYTITRDDEFGSYEGGIMYRGIGYRVMTSTSSSANGGDN